MTINLAQADGFYSSIKDACDALLKQSKINKQSITDRKVKIQQLRQDIQEKSDAKTVELNLDSPNDNNQEIDSTRRLVSKMDCDSLAKYISDISSQITHKDTQAALQTLEPMMKKAGLMKLRLQYLSELECLVKDYDSEKLAQSKIHSIAAALELSQERLAEALASTKAESASVTPVMTTPKEAEVKSVVEAVKEPVLEAAKTVLDTLPIESTLAATETKLKELASPLEMLETAIAAEKIEPLDLKASTKVLPALDLMDTKIETQPKANFIKSKPEPLSSILDLHIESKSTLKTDPFGKALSFNQDTTSVTKIDSLSKFLDKPVAKMDQPFGNKLAGDDLVETDLDALLKDLPSIDFDDLDDSDLTPLDKLFAKSDRHSNNELELEPQ